MVGVVRHLCPGFFRNLGWTRSPCNGIHPLVSPGWMPLHGDLYGERVSDASGKTMKRILKDPRKLSVAVAPGGFSEAVYTGFRLSESGEDADRYEVAYLLGRKGFVRLAVMQGIDIAPNYTFGCNEMYRAITWKMQELGGTGHGVSEAHESSCSQAICRYDTSYILEMIPKHHNSPNFERTSLRGRNGTSSQTR